MPIITKLSAQKRDPTRVNVFIDHHYTFSLPAELVLSRGLKKSQELSASELENLIVSCDEEKVFARIINYLSYRPRSVKEVQDRLNQYLGKGALDLKTHLMAKLTKLGYLNDQKFASWFVESRRAHRPRSRRQLAHELFLKGLPRELIEQVINDLSDDHLALSRLIAKKSGLDRPHLLAYLIRKGFPYALIKEELARGPVLSEAEGLDKTGF